MENQYEEKIWYYPYIKNDKGNKKHTEIVSWLHENFNKDDEELWKLDWLSPFNGVKKYLPENLYLLFKTQEMAVAFKLRW